MLRLLTAGALEKSGWPVRTSSGAVFTRNTAWLRSTGLFVVVDCVGPQNATRPSPSTKIVELVRPVPAVFEREAGSVAMPKTVGFVTPLSVTREVTGFHVGAPALSQPV